MSKIKTATVILLILCMVLITTALASKPQKTSFSAPAISDMENQSGRYTQPEDEIQKTPNLLENLDDFELKMENDKLEIYFNEETAGIRILNKATGYVWGGLESDNVENMNRKWKAMGNSLVTIDYFDAGLKSSRTSLSSEDVSAVYAWDKDEMVCQVSITEVQIFFSFTLKLNKDSINISMNQNSIEEQGEEKLQSVWFLPFLGSVREDSISGYFFIPDGIGALIRYSSSAQYVSAFDERVYGKDASIDELAVANDLLAKRNNDYLTELPRITVPVYGAVHGAEKNAYFAVIEKGAEHASVYASPAGYITDYSWVSSRFDYRAAYNKPVSKSGSGIASTQIAPIDFDCAVSIYFLDGENANYSGMAKTYTKLLEENKQLPQGELKKEEIPIYVDVVAADVRESFFGTSYTKLTDIKELSNIVEKLSENGINNITLSYKGWQKGGLNGTRFGKTHLDSRLGNMKALLTLRQKVSSLGGKMVLSINPMTANDDQIRPQSSSALNLSKNYSEYTRPNNRLMYPTKYYIRPYLVIENINKYTNEYKDWSFALDEIGTNIYGDYTRGAEIERSFSMDLYSKLFDNQENKPLLSNPNQYFWTSISAYINMPMKNSQYLFETDAVPFLPLLLKGRMDYYAPYANQGFYSQSHILKMIEYGAYPAFITMAAENEKISDTPLADYFSLNFSDWESEIKRVYDGVGGALKQVEGQNMINHKAIAQGIVQITYSNNTVIYINYTSDDYLLSNGVVVKSQNYYVERVN